MKTKMLALLATVFTMLFAQTDSTRAQFIAPPSFRLDSFSTKYTNSFRVAPGPWQNRLVISVTANSVYASIMTAYARENGESVVTTDFYSRSGYLLDLEYRYTTTATYRNGRLASYDTNTDGVSITFELENHVGFISSTIPAGPDGIEYRNSVEASMTWKIVNTNYNSSDYLTRANFLSPMGQVVRFDVPVAEQSSTNLILNTAAAKVKCPGYSYFVSDPERLLIERVGPIDNQQPTPPPLGVVQNFDHNGVIFLELVSPPRGAAKDEY